MGAKDAGLVGASFSCVCIRVGVAGGGGGRGRGREGQTQTGAHVRADVVTVISTSQVVTYAFQCSTSTPQTIARGSEWRPFL